jgi:hypothetical protein
MTLAVAGADGDTAGRVVQLRLARPALWLPRSSECDSDPPRFQQLAVGDKILFGREELTVAVLEPLRTLALSFNARGMEWVWQFGLYPFDDQRTRLVERGMERVPPTPLCWLGMRIAEPAGFIMTRRFLLGVKQ